MLTIFTIPKPFAGHIGTIQLNALHSWTLLQPRCEIILCGDESGVREVAKDFQVRHLPDIATNEYGTPLLSSAFERVASNAHFPRLCYINADIILLDDFVRSVQRIPFSHFMMIGQRHNVDIGRKLNFNKPDWSTDLREQALTSGRLASEFYVDYFVFTPNGQLEVLPTFAVGRPRWDSWYVFHARAMGIPVVDATRAVTAIHQDHDYSHIPHKEQGLTEGSERQWEGPEARRNRDLSIMSIGTDHRFNVLDATHVLTQKGLLPAISLKYIRKRWHSLPTLYPRIEPVKRVGDRAIAFIKSLVG